MARGLSRGVRRAQRVSSGDSRRSVREWPGKGPVDAWRRDEMTNAARGERGVVRGNVRRLITTNEGRDTATNAEAATRGAVVLGG